MMGFEFKRVVITGGSMGIGLHLAKRFIEEGAFVMVCARNPSALEKAKRGNPSLEIVQCDITNNLCPGKPLKC